MPEKNRLLAAFLSAFLGCAAESGEEPNVSSGAGLMSVGAPDTDGGETSEGGGDDDDDAADDSDGFKLDVGPGAGDEGAGDEGGDDGKCQAVDLLFVIDNSLSMADDQADLIAAFPQFADAIFAALPEGISLHVGVTTTSGFWTGPNTEDTFNCVSDYSVAELATDYWEPVAGDSPVNGERGQLYEHQGLRYFDTNTSADPQMLADWFTGAAQRGENGTNIEMMAAAAGWTLDPLRADTNAGFLRDEDAVLVLFFITDEPDKSPEPIDPFVQMVLDAKAGCGGDQCIVTAGAVPSFCYQNAGDTTLFDFMNAFGKPPASVGFIPESFNMPLPPPPDYTAILGDALVDVIAETCDAIVPEG